MARMKQSGVIVLNSDEVFERVYNNLDKITEEFAEELGRNASSVAAFALNDAQTNFGRARFARGDGSSAGRNRSGDMISKLKYRKYKKGGKNSIAAYTILIGWFGGPKYFEYQELGTGSGFNRKADYSPTFKYKGSVRGGIAGAHSLWNARQWITANTTITFAKAIARFLNR